MWTQAKTKAKKRYLKAKKERRKNRKVVSVTKEKPRPDGATSSSSHSGDEQERDGGSVIEDEAKGAISHQKESLKKADDSRPRKRRRIASIEVSVDPEEVAEPTTSLPTKSPSPPAALPLFPAPRRPDAPSKTTLALQGLDKALTQAEFIDARKVIPITPTSSSVESGIPLSEKTKKRLEELGISELFAGMSNLALSIRGINLE